MVCIVNSWEKRGFWGHFTEENTKAKILFLWFVLRFNSDELDTRLLGSTAPKGRTCHKKSCLLTSENKARASLQCVRVLAVSYGTRWWSYIMVPSSLEDPTWVWLLVLCSFDCPPTLLSVPGRHHGQQFSRTCFGVLGPSQITFGTFPCTCIVDPDFAALETIISSGRNCLLIPTSGHPWNKTVCSCVNRQLE